MIMTMTEGYKKDLTENQTPPPPLQRPRSTPQPPSPSVYIFSATVTSQDLSDRALSHEIATSPLDWHVYARLWGWSVIQTLHKQNNPFPLICRKFISCSLRVYPVVLSFSFFFSNFLPPPQRRRDDRHLLPSNFFLTAFSIFNLYSFSLPQPPLLFFSSNNPPRELTSLYKSLHPPTLSLSLSLSLMTTIFFLSFSFLSFFFFFCLHSFFVFDPYAVFPSARSLEFSSVFCHIGTQSTKNAAMIINLIQTATHRWPYL